MSALLFEGDFWNFITENLPDLFWNGEFSPIISPDVESMIEINLTGHTISHPHPKASEELVQCSVSELAVSERRRRHYETFLSGGKLCDPVLWRPSGKALLSWD